MNFLYALYNLISGPGLVATALAAVLGAGCGILWSRVRVLKGRRRILDLEEEMLRSHAQILSLEKQNSELRGQQAPREASVAKLRLMTAVSA